MDKILGTPSSAPFLQTLSRLVCEKLPPASISHGQWPELIRLAEDHGLGPMLLRAVRRGGINAAQDPLWRPLLDSCRSAAVQNLLKEKALLAVEGALAPAGISTVWLKGAALAYTVYPVPHLRPMADLDVLVRPERLDEALGLLQSLGYRPTGQPTLFSEADLKLARKVEYHVSLHGGPARAVLLEVHHRLMSGGGSLLTEEGLEWFRRETETFSLEGTPVPVLKAEAQLLHLIAHAFLNHGEEDSDLLHILDMHLLVTRRGIDWHLFLDRAIGLGWDAAADLALAYCRQLFQTPVPEHVCGTLHRRRMRNSMADRMRNLKGSGARFQRVVDDFRDLGLSEQTRYICRMAFPPPAYLREVHAAPAGAALWPFYLHRWLGQAKSLLTWLRKRRSR